LEEVGKRAEAILDKNKLERIPDKSVDSQEVVNLVEEIRSAIVYYQVSRDHMG